MSRSRADRSLRPPRRAVALLAAALATLVAAPAGAERHVAFPVSDTEDGELVGGTLWLPRPSDAVLDDLLLTVGEEGGVEHAVALAFAVPHVDPGAAVGDARLRVNEQGGDVGDGFTIRVTAARVVDPLATPAGPPRFALPRTTAAVDWPLGAPWDSSGQLVAKWEESPDLAALLEEVAARPGWGDSPRVVQLFLEPVDAAPGERVRFDDTHARWWNGGNAGIRPARLRTSDGFLDAFAGRELLCRPRPDRIEVNLVPHAAAEIEIDWGETAAGPVRTTPRVAAAAGEAVHVVLDGLEAGARYVYRVRARPPGGAWDAGPLRRFRALPVRGQPLRFVATADLHVTNTSFQGYDEDLALLGRTFELMLDRHADPPDLWLDLGDLVVIRATRVVFDAEETEQRYREAREWIDRVGHSVPFVLVRGNHEEVSGWEDDGTPDNDAVWSGGALLKWFPPPLPDGFVSGNDSPHPVLGLPGNFFAFDAGNVRFRCADPYLATVRRPHEGHGEVDGSGDGWDWTLGNAQYAWLAADLDAHPAPFPVFALHHLTSTYAGPGRWYGRGGVEVAKWKVSGRPSFEWGGEDGTGADVLAARRPTFDRGAVHDLLVAGGNRVLLKGHDHFAARQELDGMIYLTLPKPDDTGARTGDLWGWRGSSHYEEAETVFRENSGYLEVTVDGSRAEWRSVRTWPDALYGLVEHEFTLKAPAGVDAAPASPWPEATRIAGVSPNPFRSSCVLQLAFDRRGPARVEIVDVAGRRVATLADRDFPRGRTDLAWDGTDDRGRAVASGVYVAVVRRDGTSAARTLVVRR